MAEALIGIGSNIGDKIKNIDSAIKALGLMPGIDIAEISGYYETAPFNVPDKQEDYINCCLRLITGYTPKVLLGICLGIEAAMGRERKFRFCSRIIDIDILAYGNEIINDEELVLPHPRIKERAFVMAPLSEICENSQFGVLDFRSELESVSKAGIRKINKN